MINKTDMLVTLPAELFSDLSTVIFQGLKHSNLLRKNQKEIKAWWTAESNLIEDGLLTMDNFIVDITLPAEYFDDISTVIFQGLKFTKLHRKIRKEIKAWWTAESNLIKNKLSTLDNYTKESLPRDMPFDTDFNYELT
ncbi:MAG TPA: hypothetical protein PLC59_04000 [Bacteroidales bacterium]|jgi:hypothetical protein|nr:hypothetical protein [Bacteroidales bacterium]